ncbi:hypothetical protein ED733_001528 [Metarhizium rileyi]|uniref:Acyltransferase 3 domain-containing protein n=1 Tax=Metarhizium rileyi (strain RCEF 4871) TaxID=1649241 RepID=A0A5C6G4M4_METRR|nr:hypothetical protein ED733_001528 [Metarhizium rileyi]
MQNTPPSTQMFKKVVESTPKILTCCAQGFVHLRYAQPSDGDINDLSRGLSSSAHDVEETDLNRYLDRPRSYVEVVQSFLFLYVFARLRCLFIAMVPSFLINYYYNTKPKELRKTLFLDGLRGYASFIVVIFHLEVIEPHDQWIREHWGTNEKDDLGSNILQLPFIRVLFSGLPMVTCFFLISGFVLSYRNVQLIRSGEYEKLSESVTSLIFRRGFRLFLPSIAGILLQRVLLPWMYWNPPSTQTMMNDVYNETSMLLNHWSFDDHNMKLGHLWTIPVEFTCFVVLFVVIVGVARLGTWVRLSVVGALIMHSNASGHWAVALFMIGLFLAECEEIIEEQKGIQEAGAWIGKRERWISRLQSLFWITVFLAGLYLAGYPERFVDRSHDYSWIYLYTPQVYVDMGEPLPVMFWVSAASTLVVVALLRLSALQKAFTTPVAQYLGDISYSI